MTNSIDWTAHLAPHAGKVVLDFTASGSLPPPLLRRLDELALSERDAFNLMIAALSRGREHEIDWWVARPAGRDTHVSRLFTNCLQLALLRECLDAGVPAMVRTDSAAFARIISSAGVEVELVRPFSSRIRAFVAHGWNIGSCLYNYLFACLAANATRRHARPVPPTPLYLLEVYISDLDFDAGEFVDRYYPGFVKSLTDGERRQVYYLPSFHRVRHYFRTLSRMRRGAANFLLREDFLDISDYAFAFGHWGRVGKFLGNSASFAGFSVGPLVDEVIRAGRFASISIRALLAYRFWLRWNPDKRPIVRLVDWFEGQALDHATAAAINWHRKPLDLIGFRSVSGSAYLSVFPAAHEIDAGIIPATMAPVGEGFRAAMQADTPTLRIRPAPGLRHLGIRNVERGAAPGPDCLPLVLLPLDQKLAREIRRMLDGVISSTRWPKWRVKCHPAVPRSVAERNFAPLPPNVEFVTGNYYEWLGRTAATLGSATNSLVEAAAAGVPAICLATGNQPTEIPLPEWLNSPCWRVCYSGEEVTQALEELLDCRDTPENLERFQTALFGPMRLDEMRTLLMLSADSSTQAS